MNNKITFLNDGSFKLPHDLEDLYRKGMAYTVMLKVGEGIVFLPYHQMGYTDDIPLKYDTVEKDGYLRIPVSMMKLFHRLEFTMICSAYSWRCNDGVIITNLQNTSKKTFSWEKYDIVGTLNPWEIPHRPQKLVYNERKRNRPKFKFVTNNQDTKPDTSK